MRQTELGQVGQPGQGCDFVGRQDRFDPCRTVSYRLGRIVGHKKPSKKARGRRWDRPGRSSRPRATVLKLPARKPVDRVGTLTPAIEADGFPPDSTPLFDLETSGPFQPITCSCTGETKSGQTIQIIGSLSTQTN